MGKEKVKMCSPWMTYFHKLEAFFEKDDDITVKYKESDFEDSINIYVDGDPDKADALTQLLPAEKKFGNVVVKINVIPSNSFGDSKFSLLQRALYGNEALSYTDTVTPPGTSNPFHFIVFEKEVVQYWNDNLGDINGLESTLYENLAREIFDEDGDSYGIFFCTDNT